MDLLHPVTAHEMQQAEALVGGLFEKMAGFISCEADIETLLIAGADNIRYAADIFRRTRHFERALDKYERFKADVDAEQPPQGRLVYSWMWLASRLANAPTRLHMRSALYLCVPLVAEYLPAPQQPAQEQP